MDEQFPLQRRKHLAVGDVTDRINSTPVAIREAAAAFAETEFRGRPTRFDHEAVASAVFSQPPVGAVGLTEGQARQRGGKVVIYRSVFRPMKSTFYGGDERMLVKLVIEEATDRILGCHIVGTDAPEMIQLAAIAVKMGVTKAQWDDTLRRASDRGRGVGDPARTLRADLVVAVEAAYFDGRWSKPPRLHRVGRDMSRALGAVVLEVALGQAHSGRLSGPGRARCGSRANWRACRPWCSPARQGG